MCLLDVPKKEIEQWKEAALMTILYISGSIDPDDTDIPDLFLECNLLKHTTQLGTLGSMNSYTHTSMQEQ